MFRPLFQINESKRKLIFEGSIVIIVSIFIKLYFKKHLENYISCSANYIFWSEVLHLEQNMFVFHSYPSTLFLSCNTAKTTCIDILVHFSASLKMSVVAMQGHQLTPPSQDQLPLKSFVSYLPCQ